MTSPIWLILIAVAVPAILGWRSYLRAPGVPRLLRSVAFLRAGALLCLILALAGAQWMTKRRAVDLIFVADVSLSITPTAGDQGLEFIRTAAKQVRKHDRAGLIAFAREAYIDQPLGARLGQLKKIEASPERGETDLQAALQLALAAADVNRNTRVVVVSDGLATKGDVESLVSEFRSRGIPIDTFSLQSMPAKEASIEQVSAPSRVGQNQPFSVRVVTAATFNTRAKLRLFRNGALLADRTVDMQAGRNVYDFTGFKEQSGVNTFEARLEVVEDTFQQNNVGYASVTVEGPSRLLFVTDNTTASAGLLNALRRQGMRVDVTGTSALAANAGTLSTYEALLLHDISALKLSRTQQAQIASYVRDLGGGLVVIGGYNSYGLGGYFKTPLEDILPVAMDVPQTLVMPSLAMVLILDKSGSMAETQGKLSKVDLAKEAALGVLDVMTDRDLFGLLAFESEPKWIVPLQPATERIGMAQQIGTLTADGGTDMGPAMLEAHNVLQKSDAMVKHAIILSDGQSLEYDFAGITKKLKDAGVTVSTVAIGTDADRNLLSDIANWGSGRFYYTDDFRTIPQIFATEALVVSRPLAVEETFRPKVRQTAAFLSGLNQNSLPALDGYVLTSPKATSAVHLETAEQNPILASWRHGLGRVVAFTSGVTSTWAADWLRWSGFGSFWSQTVRWAMRPNSSSNLRTNFDIHEGQGSLVVDAIDPQGRFVNFLGLQAEVLSPSGVRQTLELAQTAPGQYQAVFPAGEQGTWLAAIADQNNAQYRQPAVIGTVLPYSAEYRLTGVDSGVLERLAKLTGGKIFTGDKIPSRAELRSLLRHPHPVRAAVSLLPLLLFLAFLLFLADIVLRYLPPGMAEKLERWLQAHLPKQLNSRWILTSQQPVADDSDANSAPDDAPTAEATLIPSTSAPETGYLRFDDLVHRRRTADLTARPRYQTGPSDPAKSAAQYLAKLRAERKTKKAAGENPSGPDDTEG